MTLGDVRSRFAHLQGLPPVERRRPWRSAAEGGATTIVFPRPLVAAALLLASVGVASAGARLKTAAPAPGATVAAAPTELRLGFDGAMKPKPTAVTLTGSSGRIPLAAAAPAPDDDKVLVVPIAGPLTPGTYTVDWRATAADGRKVSGSYGFTIIP